MTAFAVIACDLPRHQLDGDDALHPAVIDQQLRHEPLVVADDAGVLQRGLEEGVEHVEAGLVGGEPRAHLLHAAERAHGDAAVRLAAPRAAPVLQPEQLLGGFLDEGLDGVLVAQPVAAGDGVVGVFVEAVVRADHGRGAALGRDRVAAHRVDLGDDGDAEPGVGLGDGDGRAQPGPAAADQDHVMGRGHGQPQESEDQESGIRSQESERAGLTHPDP